MQKFLIEYEDAANSATAKSTPPPPNRVWWEMAEKGYSMWVYYMYCVSQEQLALKTTDSYGAIWKCIW